MTTPDYLDKPVKVTVSASDGTELLSVSGVFVIDHTYEGIRTVIVKNEDGDLRWVQPGEEHQVDISLTV